jgi:hypothetical protein
MVYSTIKENVLSGMKRVLFPILLKLSSYRIPAQYKRETNHPKGLIAFLVLCYTFIANSNIIFEEEKTYGYS